MDIPYLITLLQNKLNYLSNARSSAAAVGDAGGVSGIDQDILTTQNTLAQLNLLIQFNQTASAQNANAADVIASAISAAQTKGPSASAIINGYDVSAYATDPLYEQKIQRIVDAMPLFADAAGIDTYIQNFAPASPVTGAMIITAMQAYNVNLPLLIAIMQNDSAFGTTGVGARTNNPGNVGNTGSAERSYPSWQDGVSAVAEWLSTHRYVPVVATPTPVVPPVVTPPATPAPTTTPDTTATPSPTTTPDTTATPSPTTTPDTTATPSPTTTPDTTVAPSTDSSSSAAPAN